MKVKNGHRSKFSNILNKGEAEKNQGFNGTQTCDLHDTIAGIFHSVW